MTSKYLPAALMWIILLFCTSDAGTTPSRAMNRIGGGVYLLGPVRPVSLYADMYVIPRLDVEIFGGYASLTYLGDVNEISAGIGFKYHLFGARPSSRWSPYFGISERMIYISATLLKTEKFSGVVSGTYFPVGIELVAFNGFTVAVEGAFDLTLGSFSASAETDTVRVGSQWNYQKESIRYKPASMPIFGVKVGYHFRARKYKNQYHSAGKPD